MLCRWMRHRCEPLAWACDSFLKMLQSASCHLRADFRSGFEARDLIFTEIGSQHGIQAGEQQQNDCHHHAHRTHALERLACYVLAHPELPLEAQVKLKQQCCLSRDRENTHTHTSILRMSGREPRHSRKSAGIVCIAASSSRVTAVSSACCRHVWACGATVTRQHAQGRRVRTQSESTPADHRQP